VAAQWTFVNAEQGRAAAAIEAALAELGLEAQRPQPGSFLVRLAGQRKLATMTWLIAGEHSLHVEAFFCRQPDENHASFYRFLLERNGRMYGVHFAVDEVGDVYLVGRLPLAAVSTPEIDRVLGCVLTYSDENFNRALEIGFASSIRREWAWRVKRGESLANLQAFARFASHDPEPAARGPAPAGTGPAPAGTGPVPAGTDPVPAGEGPASAGAAGDDTRPAGEEG
jgi:hypothetical protein